MPSSKERIQKLAKHALADIDRVLKIKEELDKVLKISEPDLHHAKEDLGEILKDRFDVD